MILRDSLYLLALPVLLLIVLILRKRYPQKAFLFPSSDNIGSLRPSFKVWLSRKLIYLRAGAIILLVFALARPMLSDMSDARKKGIAMVLCIDCSSTMLAEDLQLSPFEMLSLTYEPLKGKSMSRIDAAREVAGDFIRSRPNDMIGIVAFAAQAYVMAPPTFDKEWLLRSLARIRVGLIKDATAIGSGIMSSLSSLKNVSAGSKVIVLVTDGINNYGEIPPLVAAKAARSLGVKIYTIGIASKAPAPVPVKGPDGRKKYEKVFISIDEDTLKQIASLTGGSYYRVTSETALKNSYANIDKLEKTELEEFAFDEHKDMFAPFAVWAAVLLLLDIALGGIYLRKIP
jgi:Ca-activated chloride channel family protein